MVIIRQSGSGLVAEWELAPDTLHNTTRQYKV
jgi:hypothetical protein